MKKTSFEKLFVGKEYEEIAGEGYKGVVVLTIILFITFAALSHVFGGLYELNRRMVNPYTNWININKKGLNKQLQLRFMNDFNENEDIKNTYGIKSITTYNRDFIDIFDVKLNDNLSFKYRTIEFSDQDPLYNAICDKENVVYANTSTESIDDCSLVISEEAYGRLIKEKDYNTNLNLPLMYTDKVYTDLDYILEIKLAYVVKKLPNDVDLILSNNLSTLLDKDNSFVKQSNESLHVMSYDSSLVWSSLEKYVEEEFDVSILDRQSVNTDYYGSNYLGQKYLFDRVLNSSQLDSLREKYKVQFALDYDCFESSLNPDEFYYSVNFESTGKIREFSTVADSIYQVKVPLIDVESKDNFYLMSRLALLFIVLLILFSVFSIVAFLYNIIHSHLSKISSNLGTLAAFGLSNSRVSSLYMHVFFKYFMTSSVFSIFLLLFYRTILKIFYNSMVFNLLDVRLLLIWLLVLVILVIFFKRVIRKILFRTPGDLIYRR